VRNYYGTESESVCVCVSCGVRYTLSKRAERSVPAPGHVLDPSMFDAAAANQISIARQASNVVARQTSNISVFSHGAAMST
jgi:hypothetical protein